METKYRNSGYFKIGQYVTHNGLYYLINDINTFKYPREANITSWGDNRKVAFEEIEHVKLSTDVLKKCGFYKIDEMCSDFIIAYANNRILVNVVLADIGVDENDERNLFVWENTTHVDINLKPKAIQIEYLYNLQDVFTTNTDTKLQVNLMYNDMIIKNYRQNLELCEEWNKNNKQDENE